MIKREFWEQVAKVWIKEEETELPDIDLDIEVPEESFNMDNVRDWELMLEELLS